MYLGLLEKLKNQVKENMSADNFKEYSVSWSENGGINAVDHKDYLDLLEKDFYERVTRLIDGAVERQDQSIKVGFYFMMIYSTLERECSQ